jgi:hypothetical protein
MGTPYTGMQQEIVKVVTVDAVLAICFGTVQKDTSLEE